MLRLARLVAGMVVAWGLVLASPAMAQQGDDADVLNAQVIKLYGEGKYTEAIPLAEKSLALARAQKGETAPSTARQE